MEKRGTRTTIGSQRVGYLIVAKFVCHGKDMKKLKFEKSNH